MSCNQQNWIFCAVFVFGCFVNSSIGQLAADERNNPPVGAFRIYPKTHFQCTGRPSGYYADVESGCQVYHMCDELGRQFSYSCPNTTLFQQRMLICDHWYMVNCSRAESNYAANLLIGQKDKPFVPEEEDIQRTPRPDLLDRPYAPDYSGESFRNQYKYNPQFINSLDDVDLRKQTERKSTQETDQSKFAAHYSVPGHWTLANVPAFRSNTESTIQLPSEYNSEHSRYSARSTEEQPIEEKTARRRQDDGFKIETPSDQSTVDNQNAANTFDLGVSSSQDSRRSEDEQHFENSLRLDSPTHRHSTVRPHTFPSTTTTTTTTFAPTSIHHFSTPTIETVTFGKPLTTTTTEELDTTIGRSPDNFQSSTPDYNNFEILRTSTRSSSKHSLISKDPSINTNPAVEIKNRSKPEMSDSNGIGAAIIIPSKIPVQKHPNGIELPPIDLLPPFETLRLYDDSTTQGPPIYYEWKMPASALEPPEYTERTTQHSFNDPNPNKSQNPIPVPSDRLQPPKFPNETKSPPSSVTKVPSTDLLPPAESNKQNVIRQFANNPFLSSAFALSSSGNKDQQKLNKSPTPRSIGTATGSKSNFIQNQLKKLKDTNYLDLRKSLFIPDFTFPLETDGNRGSYQADTAVNSFQIKIPKSNDTPWYGENDQCPECHPSFLKPGSCEPCIKIR